MMIEIVGRGKLMISEPAESYFCLVKIGRPILELSLISHLGIVDEPDENISRMIRVILRGQFVLDLKEQIAVFRVHLN